MAAALCGVVLTAVALNRGDGDDPRSFPQVPRAFPGSVSVGTGAPAVAATGDVRELTRRMIRSTEAVWQRVFARAGDRYEPARFAGFLEDPGAESCTDREEDITGLYCPKERTIFLRRADFDRLDREAWHYVVAHEVGHHVQELRGTLEATDERLSARPVDVKELERRGEMQADCYAGVWARAAGADRALVHVAGHGAWFREGRETGRPGVCEPWVSTDP